MSCKRKKRLKRDNHYSVRFGNDGISTVNPANFDSAKHGKDVLKFIFAFMHRRVISFSHTTWQMCSAQAKASTVSATPNKHMTLLDQWLCMCVWVYINGFYVCMEYIANDRNQTALLLTPWLLVRRKNYIVCIYLVYISQIFFLLLCHIQFVLSVTLVYLQMRLTNCIDVFFSAFPSEIQ